MNTENGMQIRIGTRWTSAVCTTEVIVVRGPGEEIELRCGGRPMVPHGAAADGRADAEPDAEWAGGTLMGKRYAHEDSGLEVLVTKAGAGTLSAGNIVLPLKDAKALPSSD